MKKIAALTLVIAALAGDTASAQFYVRAGLGYAAPAAGQSMSGEAYAYSGSMSASNDFSIKNISFSSGLQGLVSAGYISRSHIGAQLDILAGLISPQYTYTQYSVPVNYGGSSILSDVTLKHQANHPIVISPTVVIESGGKLLNLYCRVGPALPVNTKITQDRVYKNLPGTGAITTTDIQWNISSSFSLGYTGAAGVNYKLNDRMSIWGEVSILSLSVSVKQEDLSAYIRNGQSYSLSSISGIKTFYYSKTGIADTNYIHNPTYSQPFSNVSFNIGARFNLSGSKSHHSAARRDDEFQK